MSDARLISWRRAQGVDDSTWYRITAQTDVVVSYEIVREIEKQALRAERARLMEKIEENLHEYWCGDMENASCERCKGLDSAILIIRNTESREMK